MTARFDRTDRHFMHRALELAAEGLFTTRPNPRVGCVLVRDAEIVGEGFHARAGEAHAEVHALAAAGERARGATAYVSLEPCAHHGRTPPCADALIAAGVARVVCASTDSNPRVDGGGVARLRAHGIRVDTGLLGSRARALNAGFFARMERGRPWLRGKIAASLDGHSALASGESRWVTGPAARADVQRWRARACAILSGADTVIADDPALTVRIDTHGQETREDRTDIPQPLRVIVDGRLRVPADARTFGLPGPCLVVCHESAPRASAEALAAGGVEVLPLPGAGGHVDLHALLRHLAARDVNEVHTEAGPQLLGALLHAGLVDELLWYVAPHLLGTGARPALAAGPFTSMHERIELRLLATRRIGPDLRLRLTPLPRPERTAHDSG